MSHLKFSLLLCIYAKDNPVHLRQCLDSILAQTVLPDEFIVVKDGLLTDELEQVLAQTVFPFEVRTVALPENVTLGPARAKGVEAAGNEWVAVMDSDDICRPDRFEKQLALIAANPSAGLIGGQIEEFRDAPGDLGKVRSVPITHAEIALYAKKRCPFNHMTVMFRRDLVLKAGNYECFPLFEDYDLWARMIGCGIICANSPDVLVDARVDAGTYERRRGFKYMRSEWVFQRRLLRSGQIGFAGFLRNVVLRIPVRILPSGILKVLYNRFLRP